MNRIHSSLAAIALACLISGCGESSHNDAPADNTTASDASKEMLKVTNGNTNTGGSTKDFGNNVADQMKNGFGKR